MSFHVRNLLNFHNFAAPNRTNAPNSQPASRSPLSRLAVLFAFWLLTALHGGGAAQNSEPPSDISGAPHSIKTVFLIIMENHNWTGAGSDSLKQNDAAPYINHVLVPQASPALQYYN